VAGLADCRVTAIGLLAISLGAWAQTPAPALVRGGWFWYLGTLVPVIGIVQVGLQARADHYTYIR